VSLISHGVWFRPHRRIVVGIGRTRRANFSRALTLSRIQAALEVLTFRNRPEQVTAFRHELTELVRRLDAKGLLLA
jgi:hypothetical protein